MADSIRLEIITPEKLFYDNQVELVIVRTKSGDEGFMAHHAWACKLLAIGEIWVKEVGSKTFKIGVISSGFIDVKSNITIFTDIAEWQEDIDVDRAKERLEAAQKYFESNKREDSDDEEFEKTEVSLKKAMTRLSVAGGGDRRKQG
jgi:F-type H+-transporting ATPase subunit epsilon